LSPRGYTDRVQKEFNIPGGLVMRVMFAADNECSNGIDILRQEGF